MKAIKYIVLILLIVVGLKAILAVDPEPPMSITVVSSSRHNTSGEFNLTGSNASQAGNVTYLSIVSSGTTKTWSAYYGNVSGLLALENVQGKTVYSWNLSSPGGKVLVTESTVPDWTSVYCWNWSNSILQGFRASEWNLNFSANGIDMVNSTFNASYNYSDFYIAGRLFDHDGTSDNNEIDLCPAVQLYNNSESASMDTHQYEEIILARVTPQSITDYDYHQLIYTALVDPDGIGFTGEQVDFEIIVPNNGHGSNPTNTNYYFYVELEAG